MINSYFPTLLGTDEYLDPVPQTSWAHLVHTGQHPVNQPGKYGHIE